MGFNVEDLQGAGQKERLILVHEDAVFYIDLSYLTFQNFRPKYHRTQLHTQRLARPRAAALPPRSPPTMFNSLLEPSKAPSCPDTSDSAAAAAGTAGGEDGAERDTAGGDADGAQNPGAESVFLDGVKATAAGTPPTSSTKARGGKRGERAGSTLGMLMSGARSGAGAAGAPAPVRNGPQAVAEGSVAARARTSGKGVRSHAEQSVTGSGN